MSPHPRSRATPRTTRSAAALAALVVTLTVSACTPEEVPELNSSLQNAANQQSADSTRQATPTPGASPTGSANSSDSPETGESAPFRRNLANDADSLETGESAPPSTSGSAPTSTSGSAAPSTTRSAAPSTSGSAAPSTTRSAAPSTTDSADGDSGSATSDSGDAGPRPITKRPEPKGDGRLLFVDPGKGNDSNDGTEARPLKTPQEAADKANPGDVVVLRAGDHPSFTVTRSGAPGKDIVFTTEPGKTARVVMDRDDFNGVKVNGASHITLQGLHVVGLAKTISEEFALSQRNDRRNPLTNGNCVNISPARGSTPTDIVVTDVRASDCSGGGIGSQESNRVTITHSLVEGSSKYSVFGTSPIGFLSPKETDGPDFMKFLNNISRNNRQIVPWIDNPAPDKNGLTEGHGFSLDRGVGYNGKIEVKFNRSENNGGSGIQCLKVSNVEIIGNTTSGNVANLPNGSEISILTCSKVLAENNLMDPRDGRQGFFFTRSSKDVVERNNRVK